MAKNCQNFEVIRSIFICLGVFVEPVPHRRKTVRSLADRLTNDDSLVISLIQSGPMEFIMKYVIATVAAFGLTAPAFAGNVDPATDDNEVIIPQVSSSSAGAAGLAGGLGAGAAIGGLALVGLAAAANSGSSSSSSSSTSGGGI